MLRKSLFASAILSFIAISHADNVNSTSYAPENLNGHQIIMSYYQATGDLVNKIGLTYYANLKENTFYSAHLDGTDGHDGYYSYHRTSNTEGVITVEHPTGPYKGWTYDMNLHFKGPDLGTFNVVDQGMVNGTLQGVFTLN